MNRVSFFSAFDSDTLLTYALQIRLYCITSDNVTKVALFAELPQPRNEKMKGDEREEEKNNRLIDILLLSSIFLS